MSYYLVLYFTLLFIYLFFRSILFILCYVSAPRTFGEAKSFEINENLVEPWLLV